MKNQENMKKIIVLFLFASTLNVYSQFKYEDSDLPYVHTLDFMRLVTRVINPNGYGYDSTYLEMISKPSKYLTDFIGIFPVQKVSKDRIKNDLVPGYAKVLSETDSTVELEFTGGWKAIWYYNCAFSFRGMRVNYPHIDFYDAKTFQEFLSYEGELISILEEEKLTGVYLLTNPYYELELKVDKILTSNASKAKTRVDSLGTRFQECKDCVFIVPDNVHGNIERYNELVSILEEQEFDWFGLEMLNVLVQDDLEILMTHREGSKKYEKAKKVIQENIWVRFEEDKQQGPDENNYYKLLMMVKEKGKMAYALDMYLDYILFRNGETKYGAKVRNYIWASSVPGRGKGIVFGGGAHFHGDELGNFQDFYKISNPESEIFILYPKRY